MMSRIKIVFLLLVFTQALHSIEEYYGRLWEVFPPATFLCSLVSDDLIKGFLIINIGLFAFGMLCRLVCFGKQHIHFSFFIWFWVLIEIINGIGHPIWSVTAGGYRPGLITAPFLLILAVYLAKLLLKNSEKSFIYINKH